MTKENLKFTGRCKVQIQNEGWTNLFEGDYNSCIDYCNDMSLFCISYKFEVKCLTTNLVETFGDRTINRGWKLTLNQSDIYSTQYK